MHSESLNSNVLYPPDFPFYPVAHETDVVELEQDRYEDIMSEIYDAICKEIREESFESYYEDDVDWAQLEDLDLPSEMLLLCPFCK